MADLNPTIFKAYDIRGTYPDQLNEDAVYRICRAYGTMLKGKTAIVGHDMRLSWEALFPEVLRGLTDAGLDVWDVGLVSTPLYYYCVNALKGDVGIMLTASHNPGEYNGIKPTGPQAIPSISFVSNTEIQKLANSQDFPQPPQKGRILGKKDVLNDYIEAVIKTSGLHDAGGMKVAIDTANAMGGLTAPKIAERINLKAFPLYWDIHGGFPNHEANPLHEETLIALKAKVRDEGAALGVAYDGDADRVGFVDEKGDTIPGDMITALLARQILKQHPGATILYDLRSSWSVKEEIEKAGGKAVMCQVGHGLIKRQMREGDAIFAGELSSHYYFRDFFITDNGDLAMLGILSLLKEASETASELWRPIKRYFHSGEINSQVKDQHAKLQELEDKYGPSAQTVLHLDGLTVEYADWWFNVRPSNTEPYLRLNLESKDEKQMEAKRDELLALIRS
ncbi:MAG: phosphomannomutase/phosphoglucomutase [Armatimonadetes bacterium]|nr:phosphomannomutase/phosphoglucomutase [Armatimonadota bacterium]